MLERLLDSEHDAWQRFTDRFRTPMLAFARRCGLSEAQREDAVQDALIAFVEAYRAGRYEREKGRLGSWLFALMYQSIRSHRRDAARSPIQSPGADARSGRTTFFSALPDEHEAKDAWEEDWERHAIDECLGRLRAEVSADHFRAFELTTVRRVPASEVAQQLGMSRDAVYQARFRALKRLGALRAEFEGVGEVPA